MTAIYSKQTTDALHTTNKNPAYAEFFLWCLACFYLCNPSMQMIGSMCCGYATTC